MKHHLYQWEGISLHGNKLAGEMNAKNKKEVQLFLNKKNIFPLIIYRKINLSFTSYVSNFEITLFFRQLSILLQSGTPLTICFDILHQTQKKAEFKKVILTLKQEIEAGKYLSQAFLQFPRYFDELSCNLIKTGEETGTLQKMFKQIADTKEKQYFILKKLQKSLFYPAFVFCFSILITLLMLMFVVPRFAELFTTLHGKLPTFTLFVVSLSSLVQKHGLLLIIAGISLYLFGFYLYKNIIQFKKWVDYFSLLIPLFGTHYKKVLLAQWARNLAITCASGIPLNLALKSVAPATKNSLFFQVVLNIQREVEKGYQLHIAMQTSPFFSILSIQMVKIGEESGMLVTMLEKLAHIYETEIEDWTINISQLLEPLIMLILGVLIGGIIIAMYLPIFKLGSLI